MYNQIDIFSDLIALDLGIIHPTIARAELSDIPRSIDSALASMTPEESRRCRRKFRKVLRRCSGSPSKAKWGPGRKRTAVMLDIRVKAWDKVDRSKLSDNDE